jgi:hypothetical protein
MHRVAGLAVVALCSLALALRASAQYSNLEIPTAADGYSISVTKETSTDAPAGYSGRIENIDHLAVGREPSVIGRTYKSHFTLANEIRNCPRADGTSEGDGEFTVSGVFTHTVGSTTFSSTYAMTAKAKYKGKVGDDGFLDGPVTADIDYAYTVAPAPSPRIDPISPLATSIVQHITIQFEVAKGGKLEGPSIGAFTGGDPTKGQLNQANIMGLILTYWGGVWYTFAQLHWMSPGNCVQVVFDPPSFSRQPVPGSNVKVNAYIKTKGGEGVRGKFVEVNPFSHDESVSITASNTDPGSPAIFYYTAPTKKKNARMGFGVQATSRGGAANGNWDTGLGTGWSGEITISSVSDGDVGQNELQFWSNSSTTQSTITVKDGVATAHLYYEMQSISSNKERALRNGAITLINVNSDNREGSAEATGKATLSVELSPDGTSYTLMAGFGPSPPGKSHETSCVRLDCTSTDTPLSIAPFMPQITGKYDNPNLLQGSQNSTTTGQGHSKKGKTTFNVTWYLERQGTTK